MHFALEVNFFLAMDESEHDPSVESMVSFKVPLHWKTRLHEAHVPCANIDNTMCMNAQAQVSHTQTS